MTEEVLKYALALNANQEVIDWIATTFKAHEAKQFERLKLIPLQEPEHIVDWLVSGHAPTRLRKMSYADAKRKSEEWTKANQKKGKNLKDTDDDTETVHDFLDGTRIVKLLTKKAYQREGFLMNHCVGGYSVSSDVYIYSYRDAKNLPHATFEVQKRSNEIVQIKGKGNGSIHPKYIHPILAFLKTIGMDVRPNDMKNLGYHHLHKDHIEFLKQSQAFKQITVISGEYYAHA